MQTLGELSIRNFTPKTVKKGKETTKRKKALQDAFVQQNKNIHEIQENCKGNRLSIKVTFYLNENSPDKSSFKKDLDNLLKILLDVIKEEMDDDMKKPGLGLVIKNQDEEIFEIVCNKKFVQDQEKEGIDLLISKWEE